MSSLSQCLMGLFLIKACDSMSEKVTMEKHLKTHNPIRISSSFTPLVSSGMSVTKIILYQDLEPESVPKGSPSRDTLTLVA